MDGIQGRVALRGCPALNRFRSIAGVAQLVEHQLPKLRVAGSSPVARFLERPSPESTYSFRGSFFGSRGDASGDKHPLSLAFAGGRTKPESLGIAPLSFAGFRASVDSQAEGRRFESGRPL